MKKILLAVACFAMTLLAQANPTHKVKKIGRAHV